MRRRSLLLLLCVASCAGPAPNRSLAAIPPQGRPETSAPAPLAPVKPPTVSGDINFDSWAAGFYGRAVQAGIAPAVLDRELAGLAPDPRIAALDAHQPEFSKPFSDYIKGAVTDGRAAIGGRKLAQLPQIETIEKTYGVPRQILAGIWAMESGFGVIQGNFDVVRAMATLAAQGRRRDFAEGELIAALKVIQSGEFDRARLKGSWAGAMGQTQFIPSMFLSTAVDGDRDGRRDIWRSPTDALASAANLLAKAGWAPGQSWAREVTAPADFDWSLSEGPKLTPAEWAAKGIGRADGRPWSEADKDLPAQLVVPVGAAGPAFLLFPNHFAIRKYNNSLAYALAVGLLAERVAGSGSLATPWPVETPLPLAERLTAQRALIAMGYDVGEPDGLVGLKTRAALRGWQQAQGLTADGYLTGALVQRLKAEAEAAAVGGANPPRPSAPAPR